MRGAVAAGHPLSARTGAGALAAGGNAVDALIAAVFAAMVAEGPLTGPAGGGFLLVHRGGETAVLDCFFAVPAVRLGAMEEVVIDFADAGTQSFHVGEGSVAVPGLVSGLAEAHRRFGSMRWAELVEPAIVLARDGVRQTAEQSFLREILTPILLRSEGGRRVYGDATLVHTAELAGTLEAIRDGGAGALASLLPELVDDLAAYRVVSREPLVTGYRGRAVATTPRPSRGGAIVAEILERLGHLSGAGTLAELAPIVGRAYARAHGAARLTGTTHVSVVDEWGTAAAISSTLGSGSGVFRGGCQLNNMLGELDVIGLDEREPGERLPSMMAPTLVLEERAPRLVLGSAGSVRLAGAIAQVVWRVVGRGAHVFEAIVEPRIHVEERTVHVEGGWDEASVEELARAGWDVVRWAGRNLFFGGVAAVERLPGGALAAAGDPRRGGDGIVVP